ncbi:MAG: type II toxin-antitoxin system RelE/ParE family toxin [Selenomonadaceae bacterium]|nr:type II toxin-antitoxin system RelE/ParE family toxin [Selenomonadaceae bacterium]
MYEIIYLPTARKQLEDIVDYIAAELAAPDTAFDFIDEVDKAIKSLAEMPYRHSIYHTSFAVLEEVRWISVKNYNVFYKVFEEDKTVEIRRVLLQLQDSENRLHHPKE